MQKSPWLDATTQLVLNLGCTSLVLLPIALPSLLLLCVAETAGGRLTGLACLLAVVFTVLAVARRYSKPAGKRWRARAAWGSLGLAGVLLVAAYQQSPRGEPGPNSPVRSIYLAGGSFERSSLANLVPELDQFVMGSYPVGAADLHISFAQAARLRGLLQEVYRPLRADPDFLELGSHMNLAYRELFGMSWDTGHAYVYTPGSAPKSARLPVLLFLHGSAGNFKGYTWVLKTFADQHSFALVVPSFGFGAWNEPDGVRAVERCLTWIGQQPGLNADSIVLAGLSNGGKGVTRAATAHPGAFRALFYISGVLEGARMPVLAEAWGQQRPVRLIHGAADRRLPLFSLQAAVRALAQDSAQVRLRVVEGEDHFLFFSQPELVLRAIEEMLAPR